MTLVLTVYESDISHPLELSPHFTSDFRNISSNRPISDRDCPRFKIARVECCDIINPRSKMDAYEGMDPTDEHQGSTRRTDQQHSMSPICEAASAYFVSMIGIADSREISHMARKYSDLLRLVEDIKNFN